LEQALVSILIGFTLQVNQFSQRSLLSFTYNLSSTTVLPKQELEKGSRKLQKNKKRIINLISSVALDLRKLNKFMRKFTVVIHVFLMPL